MWQSFVDVTYRPDAGITGLLLQLYSYLQACDRAQSNETPTFWRGVLISLHRGRVLHIEISVVGGMLNAQTAFENPATRIPNLYMYSTASMFVAVNLL